MNTHSVKLNPQQCRNVGREIRRYRLRNDFYARPFLSAPYDTELRYRMMFFAVAICHQTHTLHHPVLNLWGWDYLEHAFLEIAAKKPHLLDPAFLGRQQPDTLADMLSPWFAYDGNAQHCTLDRLDERTRLMIDASGFLTKHFNGKVSGLILSTQQMLINNGKGLYEIMKNTEAFADPMQKKTTFLIKLLEEAGLLKIKDTENFIPIMDYHMQRVLLRLGCVEIADDELYKKLVERKPLDSDTAVRSACIDAFRIIAGESRYPVTKMNDFFWSLGRSCCNETMLCSHGRCTKEPCTLTLIVNLKEHRQCILQSVCKGAGDEKYRKLWQPIVETHFY